MSQSTKFWNRMSGTPTDNAEVTGATSLRILESCQPYLTSVSSLLDFGCGNGKLSLALSHYVHDVIAIDTSEGMIRNANHLKKIGEVKNVSFKLKPITDDTLVPGSFDVITTFSVLHYIMDMPELMNRMQSLLKSDGYFISVTPCLGEKKSAVSMFTSLASRIRLIPQMRQYKRIELEGLISNGGNFEILENSELSTLPECFIVARKVNS